MEYIKGRLDEAINGLEHYKHKYPKMATQDVINMLKRLKDLIKDEEKILCSEKTEQSEVNNT